MAQPLARRVISRPVREPSVLSSAMDSDASPTPPMRRAPKSRVRRGLSHVSIDSSDFQASPTPNRSQTQNEAQVDSKRPAHHDLPPTIPSPFAGTLEASLDAILRFGQIFPEMRRVASLLLEAAKMNTNWPEMLLDVLTQQGSQRGRELIEELLLLATRTLLPEQIAENRALMANLFNARKSTATRLLLRYDMLRQWIITSHTHPLVLTSETPPNPLPAPPAPLYNEQYPYRRALMPNVLKTLVAPPPEGYATQQVKEKMKHHATELDIYLMVADEEVEGWSNKRLIIKASEILTQWLWLRRNNEVFAEMEVHGWADLDGKADENEWFWSVDKKGDEEAAKILMGYDDKVDRRNKKSIVEEKQEKNDAIKA